MLKKTAAGIMLILVSTCAFAQFTFNKPKSNQPARPESEILLERKGKLQAEMDKLEQNIKAALIKEQDGRNMLLNREIIKANPSLSVVKSLLEQRAVFSPEALAKSTSKDFWNFYLNDSSLKSVFPSEAVIKAIELENYDFVNFFAANFYYRLYYALVTEKSRIMNRYLAANPSLLKEKQDKFTPVTHMFFVWGASGANAKAYIENNPAALTQIVSAALEAQLKNPKESPLNIFGAGTKKGLADFLSIPVFYNHRYGGGKIYSEEGKDINFSAANYDAVLADILRTMNILNPGYTKKFVNFVVKNNGAVLAKPDVKYVSNLEDFINAAADAGIDVSDLPQIITKYDPAGLNGNSKKIIKTLKTGLRN